MKKKATFSLSEKACDRLKHLAHDAWMSKSEFLEKLIIYGHIECDSEKKDREYREEQRRAALPASGVLGSGVGTPHEDTASFGKSIVSTSAHKKKERDKNEGVKTAAQNIREKVKAERKGDIRSDDEVLKEAQVKLDKIKAVKKVTELTAKTIVNPSMKEIKNIEEPPPKKGVSLPDSFFNPRPKDGDK